MAGLESHNALLKEDDMREAFSSSKSVPEIMKGMLEFSHLPEKNETDKVLAELVKARASQISRRRACKK